MVGSGWLKRLLTNATPATVFGSDLEAWYRNSSLVAIGDGNPIAQWDDSSGNGRHMTQGTGTKRPVVQVVSGKYFGLGDGVDDEMASSAFGPIAQPITSAYVLELVSGANDNVTHVFEQLNAVDGGMSCFKNTTGSPDQWALNAPGVVALPAADTTRRVWVTLFNGASSYVRHNGVQIGTGNPGANALKISGAFGNIGGPQYANVRIAEKLLISKALSAGELSWLETYLQQFV